VYDQSVEVSDGCECSDSEQTISDCYDCVDGTASTESSDQLGYKVRLHYLHSTLPAAAAVTVPWGNTLRGCDDTLTLWAIFTDPVKTMYTVDCCLGVNKLSLCFTKTLLIVNFEKRKKMVKFLVHITI